MDDDDEEGEDEEEEGVEEEDVEEEDVEEEDVELGSPDLSIDLFFNNLFSSYMICIFFSHCVI